MNFIKIKRKESPKYTRHIQLGTNNKLQISIKSLTEDREKLCTIQSNKVLKKKNFEIRQRSLRILKAPAIPLPLEAHQTMGGSHPDRNILMLTKSPLPTS